jgi:hypothetical protein
MTAVESAPVDASARQHRRSTWALWGTAAGVFGVTANMLTQPSVTEAQRQGGFEEVFGELSRGSYHVGAVAGFAAVACLLLFAAGFSRWAQRQASDSLALRATPFALLASAGALIASYGVKGQLSGYLDGGFNEASYPDREVYVYYLLDDLAGWFSWWGVAVAAGCIAWLSFRERLIVRWVGALGALALLGPLAFLLAFGFTGYAGVVAPVFLVLAGIGMSRARE